MTRRDDKARTASLGVTLTQLAVERDLRWVFREQQKEDFGIDAQIEIVENGIALGLLLAVQIKGGPSWFRSRTDDGWWFREDGRHFNYWLSHSIPVIVVLADTDSEVCYWQFVSKSTVVEVKGSKWKLLVPRSQVLEASAVASLREIAEAGIRRARARGPVGVAASSLDLAELEVHAAPPGRGSLSAAPPEYLIRAHDRRLDDLVIDALGPNEKSGIAVLVASSGAGKTRALYEALHRQIDTGAATTSLAAADWRVWPAVNPLPPSRFLDELALVGSRTVVWLNEAQRYLREPSPALRTEIATGLRELLADDSRGPVLLLGTLWQEYWNELTSKPSSGEPDEFVGARRLLEGSYVRVPNTFTNAEVTAARKSSDLRLAQAAKSVTGTGVTQYLAGAPDLRRRYETADAMQRAIIHAAMDARRFGHREGLSETFLSDAASSYLTSADRQRVDGDPSWFETAIADLLRPGVASGPILHQDVFGYRLDDILDQEGRDIRRFDFPPDGFWSAAAESSLAADSRMRLASSAAARLRLQIAASLYETVNTEAAGEALYKIAMLCERGGHFRAAESLVQRAVLAGFPKALISLVKSRYGRHEDPVTLSLIRQAADLGDVEALDMLAKMLEQGGDKEEAEAVAREAVALGSWKATVSVASWRDIEFPDEAERLIDSLPAHMRTEARRKLAIDRVEVDDYSGAESLALSALADGDPQILLILAEGRAEVGEKSEANRLIDQIGPLNRIEDLLRLALIRASTGKHAEARSLVAFIVGTNRRLARRDLTSAGVGESLAVFAQWEPQAVDLLEKVLLALDERHLINRLHDELYSLHEKKPEPRSGRDEGNDEPDEETDDEVAEAYATLAGFHARRGEFQQAESLAFQAAAAGSSAGLESLSRELAQRGENKDAERLALCAVNMTTSWTWIGLRETAWTVLANAREDDSVLVLGIDADGNTAKLWTS